ncbi:hypothetical protein LXA43DRAFT_1098297 [Ganoderma leucocontextum]|nr:hypothetical protein LXA43DRAFT_1098297 [Ganoderma leucocontextum]
MCAACAEDVRAYCEARKEEWDDLEYDSDSSVAYDTESEEEDEEDGVITPWSTAHTVVSDPAAGEGIRTHLPLVALKAVHALPLSITIKFTNALSDACIVLLACRDSERRLVTPGRICEVESGNGGPGVMRAAAATIPALRIERYRALLEVKYLDNPHPSRPFGLSRSTHLYDAHLPLRAAGLEQSRDLVFRCTTRSASGTTRSKGDCTVDIVCVHKADTLVRVENEYILVTVVLTGKLGPCLSGAAAESDGYASSDGDVSTQASTDSDSHHLTHATR